MTFAAFGLNHETAPVALREMFAFSEEDRQELYGMVREQADLELILLATCNRTEVYLYGSERHVELVQGELAGIAGMDWPETHAFYVEDETAIRHVLEVASGLRSQILGDNQILAQVKEAYQEAVDADVVDTVMHRLMHTAFRTAKRVVNETGIAEGETSLSSLAVSEARSHLEESYSDVLPEDLNLLVIGAGRMGELAVQALVTEPPARLVVTNRSVEPAQELAANYDVATVPWERRYDAVAGADVVIVTTGASAPVIRRSELDDPVRSAIPTLVLDISMPRNVGPDVDDHPDYHVVDLDDLNRSLQSNWVNRQQELGAGQEIAEEALREFVSWVFYQQALQPAIQTLRETFETIRQREIERHEHRFDVMDREQLDQLTRSIMQKVLAVPIVRLKDAADSDLDLAQRVELLHTLFARSDQEEETDDVEAMKDCPYMQRHLEDSGVWRRVAKHLVQQSDGLD